MLATRKIGSSGEISRSRARFGAQSRGDRNGYALITVES